MRERAKHIGASLEVTGTAGRGTEVVAIWHNNNMEGQT
jgi:signal transduction histidine kinase